MEAALDGALLVFSERGYHAASLADLGTAMKLTAGSIYKAFSDKRAIFLAALDRYKALRDAQLRQVLEVENTGYDKLRAMLHFYAESSHDAEGRRGCLVVGGTTELGTFDEEVAARVASAMQRIETRLRDFIRLGQADGSIPPTIDVATVARTLLCFVQGLRLIGKTGRHRAEVMATVDQALRLLA
jgi:TetR/AcrR family transcriptional regulator, transcriptional repressor for nem operon